MSSETPLVPLVLQDADRIGPRALSRIVYEIPAFDAEVAREVVESIALGRKITYIGNQPGMPPYFVVNAWRQANPEFDEAVVLASEAAADMLHAETIEISDDTSRSPACREVSIRARQAAAKVLNRKKYDPAVKVEIAGGHRDADELTNEELAAMVRRKQRQEAQDAG